MVGEQILLQKPAKTRHSCHDALNLHLQLGHALLEGLVSLNRNLPQLRNLARALLGKAACALELMLQRVCPACCRLLDLPVQPSA